MKQRFIRIGDELTDDDIVVVRGGDLDPEILRHDALRKSCDLLDLRDLGLRGET